MRHKISYDPARDYYTILGIEPSATLDDIRQAYRRSVREAHPDLNPQRAEWATEQVQRINEAYNVLRQPDTRAEYDRQRWPHVGSKPAESDRAYRSPYRTTTYDNSRPWWEQVANQAPPQYPFAEAAPRRGARHAEDGSSPIWQRVSDWLKARGWLRLQKTWLSLVGLWRSPYGGILWTLAIVLSVNVAIILYVSFAPPIRSGLFNWRSGNGSASVTPQPTISPTPQRLYMSCGYPGVKISQPKAGDVVGDLFSIYGLVNTPEMWSYRIEISYLGEVFSVAAQPSRWLEVRAVPHNQSIPEPPIVDDLLTEQPVSLQGQRTGYYVLQLTVTLRSGSTVEPCDVVVRH